MNTCQRPDELLFLVVTFRLDRRELIRDVLQVLLQLSQQFLSETTSASKLCMFSLLQTIGSINWISDRKKQANAVQTSDYRKSTAQTSRQANILDLVESCFVTIICGSPTSVRLPGLVKKWRYLTTGVCLKDDETTWRATGRYTNVWTGDSAFRSVIRTGQSALLCRWSKTTGKATGQQAMITAIGVTVSTANGAVRTV